MIIKIILTSFSDLKKKRGVGGTKYREYDTYICNIHPSRSNGSAICVKAIDFQSV